MIYRQTLWCLVATLCTYTSVNCQILERPTHYCSYTTTPIAAELYLSAETVNVVEQMVQDICAAAGRSPNFKLAAANVPSIAAIQYQDSLYLLYNSAYCRRLQQNNPRQLYTLLAHAAGHLLYGHDFQEYFRLRQESTADEFMSRALFQSNAFLSIDEALDIIMGLPYAYTSAYRAPQDRWAIIRRGWTAEEDLIKSEKNLGYLGSETVQENTPLPHFELKGCPRWHEMKRSNFRHCERLEEVNETLVNALQRLGYQQRSYFSLPNGFAILTPIEQIHKDGTPLSGSARWQDYPAGGNFSGLLDYLSALLVPRHGYFRLFVFTVTDETIGNSQQKITAESAKAWLHSGGQWLPASIGQAAFSKQHRTNVFIYEFAAPESTKRLAPWCHEQLLTIDEHLLRSGLSRLFVP